ncbi:hypothetical protein M8J77_007882 [Diaphorina citri]|nr:hypothetical protein M8J77_007882 [Diaphorina citri]
MKSFPTAFLRILKRTFFKGFRRHCITAKVFKDEGFTLRRQATRHLTLTKSSLSRTGKSQQDAIAQMVARTPNTLLNFSDSPGAGVFNVLSPLRWLKENPQNENTIENTLLEPLVEDNRLETPPPPIQ